MKPVPHSTSVNSAMTSAACVLLAAAIGILPCAATAQAATGGSGAPGVESLAAIVGVWQSDTDVASGTSAVSRCAWTPSRFGVLCDQTVSTPAGTQHALSLYTFGGAQGKFVFYGLGHPGDQMSPVSLTIEGNVWTYGGLAPGPDGRTSRTINDFSAKRSYTWRQESSSNGKDWTVGAQGRSKRLR
jgi:hypothetical protein